MGTIMLSELITHIPDHENTNFEDGQIENGQITHIMLKMGVYQHIHAGAYTSTRSLIWTNVLLTSGFITERDK